MSTASGPMPIYDFTDISEPSDPSRQDDQDVIWAPPQTSYNKRRGQQQQQQQPRLTEHDRELRSFPLAMASKLFFFVACGMFLWMSIDDLYWADEARNIPAPVLQSNDDATWRNFRSRQSRGFGNVRRRVQNLRGVRMLEESFLSWDELTFSQQLAAATLGFSPTTWDNGGAVFTDTIPWSGLTSDQREAAMRLGYDQATWDTVRGFSSTTTAPTPTPPDESVGSVVMWEDLSFSQQIAAATLGFTGETWNNGGSAFTDIIPWDGLADVQKEAAMVLGYDQAMWDSVRGFTGGTRNTVNPSNKPDPIYPTLPPANTGSGTTTTTTTTTTNEDTSSTGTTTTGTNRQPETSPTLPPASDTSSSEQSSSSTTSSSNTSSGSSTNWRLYKWNELPSDIKAAAVTMGFNEDSWNNKADVATDQYSWEELSDEQRQAAATVFGYNRQSWDAEHNRKWQSYAWDDLPADVQRDAQMLGYNERLWNDGAKIANGAFTWDELSNEQQDAAFSVFGFTEETWNTSTEESASIASKNGGGGRGGGRGGADDDYVFSVEKGQDEVWVSKYQIVYFVAAVCFMIVGILDLIRERRSYHILMLIAGSFAVLAAMMIEKNLTVANIFHCFSWHFFVFQGIAAFFYRAPLRELLPGAFKNAIWMADIFFTSGALLEVVLSYVYFKEEFRTDLDVARADAFASLMFFLSSSIYVVATPVLFAKNTKDKPYLE